MPRRLNTASRLFGDEPEKAGAEVVRQCETPGSTCRRDRVRVVFLPGMRSEISHASCLREEQVLHPWFELRSSQRPGRGKILLDGRVVRPVGLSG